MLRALILTISAVALSGMAAADGGKLTGTVQSAGQAIPGATVTAVQGERRVGTVTDGAGRYEFDNLSTGPCIVEVEMFGFVSSIEETRVADGPAALDFTLKLAPYAAAPQPASPARAAGGPARPVQGRQRQAQTQAAATDGFQSLNLNQNSDPQAEQALDSAASSEAPQAEAADANEAFLVNGSLSGGLQNVPNEDMFARRAEFAQMRGGMDGGPGGPGGPGAVFGADGAQAGPAAGGGPGGGPGGMRGGGGGFGGRGGGMMGGGRGGFGGRGGARGRGPGRNANFGNRAGRGRQGFRGNLNYTFSNSALDARPYSLTGQTVAKPVYASNRFGVSLGGPLRIPKLIDSPNTFVFINYGGNIGRTGRSYTSTLPTDLQRTGDFSQTLASSPLIVYDPLSSADPSQRTPFAGNAIPADRINPAALGLLNYIPRSNQPGGVQNYQYTTAATSNTNNLSGRVMRSVTRKDRLSFNVTRQWRDSTSPQLYQFADSGTGSGVNAGVNWMHNFGPRMINNLGFTFSRNRADTLPYFAYGTDVAALLDIGGVSHDPINYGPPNLSFTNYGGLTDASALLNRTQTSAVNESISVMRTKHNITAGFGYRRMQVNNVTDQNARGTFTFTGLNTSGFDAQGQPVAGTGYDFADFLLGLPNSSSVRYGDTSTYFRGAAYNAFAIDDYRVRSNLTINLGLRYEYFPPYHEKYGHIANLDIAPGFTAVAVVTPGETGPYTGQFPGGLINPDKNNFSPRIGIAWRPSSQKQIVIRAGYGIFFNGSIYNQFISLLAQQPPFANTNSVISSTEQALTLQNGFATVPSQSIQNTYAVDRDYKVGYAQTWNFTIQQTFRRTYVVELGYLGTKGTDLDILRAPNRAAPGSPLTSQQRLQIGNATGFTFDTSQGNSVYHAAQARVTRRFARGVSVNAFYIFGKSIDNASSLGGVGSGTVAQDDQNLRAERGVSSFSRTHTLTLNYMLSTPNSEANFLHLSGWGLRLLKDWNWSSGITVASGLPFTARVAGNQSDTGGTGSLGSGRADATGLPLYDGSGFFNLAAFALPPAGSYGNAGRNTITGPGMFSMNMSLSRSFRLDDRRRMTLGVNSNNVLNHMYVTGLGTTVNANTYGLATSASGMRAVNLSLRVNF